MSEDAIFPCKYSLIASLGHSVVNISVDCGKSLEVIDLGDTLGPSEVFITALSETHGRSEFVLFVRDNVVANAVQVVCRSESGGFGTPWIGRCGILLVFGLLDHAIK